MDFKGSKTGKYWEQIGDEINDTNLNGRLLTHIYSIKTSKKSSWYSYFKIILKESWNRKIINRLTMCEFELIGTFLPKYQTFFLIFFHSILNN